MDLLESGQACSGQDGVDLHALLQPMAVLKSGQAGVDLHALV